MTSYKVLWNADSRKAKIALSTDATPSNWVAAGTFDHGSDSEADGTLEKYIYEVNHVIYQHVRDALYHIGEQNMQTVEIEYHVAVTGVTLAPTTVSVAHGSTTQLTATIAPTGADETGVTWSTSNATKATVSSTGLVTGVAAGSATITVTTKDGSYTATCAVTVT